MVLEKTINVQGYYLGDVRKDFPHSPAIFFVYGGTFNTEEHTCTLSQLLYVGQSDNLWKANNESQLWESFVSALNPGESIFYSIAFTSYNEQEREEIINALRYELRPMLNAVDDISRPGKIIIIVEGNRHAFIPTRVEAPSY